MAYARCFAFVAFALAASPALAQSDFPSRPVHVVVPYPAGGIVDVTTRIVTDRLAELWRQRFIVGQRFHIDRRIGKLQFVGRDVVNGLRARLLWLSAKFRVRTMEVVSMRRVDANANLRLIAIFQ